ncbi:MAG TPA: hypothetical protein VGQ83_14315 [Polyangia bacterium]|jgi:hypothetical protein
MRLALALAVALGVLSGCAFFMPVDTLRPRAAFDLKCPEGQLQFTELSGDCGKKLGNEYRCTIGVQGCGQQATYVHVPKSDWIMNSTGNSATPR